MIRAEKLLLAPAGTMREGALSLPATVEAVDYQGQAARYFLRMGDHSVQAINMIDDSPFAEGSTVALLLRPRDCTALPATQG